MLDAATTFEAGAIAESVRAEQADMLPCEVSGLTFVLTGTLSRPRDAVSRLIEAAAGAVSL